MLIKNIIEYYDYLLLIPYIIIFFLLARKFAKKRAETGRERYWLLINWWMRVVACILYAWMIVYYYEYGDPFGYQDRSNALLDSIVRDWRNVKYIFLPVESFRDYLLNLGYSNTSYFSDLGYYSEPVFMISRIGCVAAFFCFNRFLIISFIFTNIAYYGFVILYTTSKKIIRGFNKQLAIGCLFIPSCLFWSSGYAKEPICMISLAMLFSGSVALFFQKKIRIGIILQLYFFKYILVTVKDYIFYCFLTAFVLWVSYNLIRYLVSKSVVIKLYSLLFFIVLAAAITYYFRSSSLTSIVADNIGDVVSYNLDMYESMSASTQGGGSLIKVTDIDISSSTGILKFIPQALMNVFFRPFPWEISNVLMIFAVMENLFFMFLFIRVFVKSRLFTRRLGIQNNYQVFAIIISILLAFLVGISTFNFGSMARYKMPLLPFWACFLLILNKKISEKKKLVNV